jgi:hypothetical protein
MIRKKNGGKKSCELNNLPQLIVGFMEPERVVLVPLHTFFEP